ncbi:hypothetical protein [Niastella vici]|nr:hypothetical protein [Niastella vici]
MPEDQIPLSGTNLAYTIATILFALSLISERIANLYKLYWRNLRNKRTAIGEEKLRERKVMWTALVCGWIVAVIGGADLFTLLSSGKLIDIFNAGLPGKFRSYIGFFLSGIFISLGSKFWHDMLDIVLQFSNLKKFQADQQQQETQITQTQTASNRARFEKILIEKTANVLPRLQQLEGFSGYDVNSENGQMTVQLKFLNKLPDGTDKEWIYNYYEPDTVIFENLNNNVFLNATQSR